MKTVSFKAGNKIKYGQDMRFFQGLTHSVNFEVDRLNGGYVLTAYGYGKRGTRSAYGNGSIFVYYPSLNKCYINKLEKACSTPKPEKPKEEIIYKIWDNAKEGWWNGTNSGRPNWSSRKRAENIIKNSGYNHLQEGRLEVVAFKLVRINQ